jgi:hypothetical protein
MKLTHNILLVSFVPALLQAANLKHFNPGYCYRQKDQLAQPTNLNRMHRYRFNVSKVNSSDPLSAVRLAPNRWVWIEERMMS